MKIIFHSLLLLLMCTASGCNKESVAKVPEVNKPDSIIPIGEIINLIPQTDPNIWIYHQKWSPDGSMIVYTKQYRNQNRYELWIYEIEADSNYAIVEEMSGDLTPSWSPDSKKIVFDAYESPTNQRLQIWIKNLITDELYQFTNYNSPCITPSWSNDGNYIVFQSGNELKIKNINNGLFSSIPNTTGGGSPHWKFDDSEIVYVSGSDNDRNISTTSLDGSNQNQITFFPGQKNRPQWSPDGKKVVFEVYGENSQRHAYIYETTTGKTFQVGENFAAWNPSWSPDGTKILFTRNGTEISTIKIY